MPCAASEAFAGVVEMAEYARREINNIGGYYAYSRELINGDSIYDFDVTKLAVNTLDIGLAGIEVYDLLRDEYDIQIEFGDLGNLLAYLSIGDRQRDVERLVGALCRGAPPLWPQGQGQPDEAGIHRPRGRRLPAGGLLRRQGVAPAAPDRGPHLQRVCDVLPAGHPDSGPGRADHRPQF